MKLSLRQVTIVTIVAIVAVVAPSGVLGFNPGLRVCDDASACTTASASGPNDLGYSYTETMCSEKYANLASGLDVIDRYEIFPVGDELTTCCDYPKPIGKISSLDAFLGETYFEVSDVYFDTAVTSAVTESAETSGYAATEKIVLEFSVWANGGNGDCDSSEDEDSTTPTTRLDAYFVTEISHLTALQYNNNYDYTITEVTNDNRIDGFPFTSSSSAVPYLSDSTIGQGTFSLESAHQDKLFIEGLDSGLGLYFPNTDTSPLDPNDSGQVGELKLCTRLEYFRNYKGVGSDSSVTVDTDGSTLNSKKDSISILDTNYIINVDLTADFSTFNSADVQIFKRANTELKTDESVTIAVDAYNCDANNAALVDNVGVLCGSGGEDCTGKTSGQVREKDTSTNIYTDWVEITSFTPCTPGKECYWREGPAAAVEFTDGQDFRVCVKPSVPNGFYSVKRFKSVICSNANPIILNGGGETRQIVVNYAPDALTTLQPFADNANINGNGGTDSVFGSLAFTSVVTSGFLNPDINGDTFNEFSCTGEVELSVNDLGDSYNDVVFTAPPTTRRGLSAKINFSTSNKSSTNGIKRKIQEAEEPSPFGVAIKLSDPTSSESSSPSSYGPLLGHYYMAIFGAVIASAAVALL